MESEENTMERESLDFLANCSVDDFVALYEHMTLCKLEEVQDDTLDRRVIPKSVEHLFRLTKW
jgi:hypothetical protein